MFARELVGLDRGGIMTRMVRSQPDRVHGGSARHLRKGRLVLLVLGGVAMLLAAWWIGRREEQRVGDGGGDHAALEQAGGFRVVDPDEGKPPARDSAGKFLRQPRRFDTFAHWLLDLEAEVDFISADRYARLDAIISDALLRIRTVDATITTSPATRATDQSRERRGHVNSPERQRAEAILKAIDQVLTGHRVLYPRGEHDVTSLRLGLCPQQFDADTLARLLRLSFNARRGFSATATQSGAPMPSRHTADQSWLVMDCDVTSILYLSIGQAAGFELRLVELPDHVFVRWMLPDGSYLNWDTNLGTSADDGEYVVEYELTDRPRRERIYLASLSLEESRGYGYWMRSQRRRARKQLVEALADLHEAKGRYPQSLAIKADLAWLYATMEGDAATAAHRHKLALELASLVTELEPACGTFWDSLAAAQAAEGDFVAARASIDRAIARADTPRHREEYRSHRQRLLARQRLLPDSRSGD